MKKRFNFSHLITCFMLWGLLLMGGCQHDDLPPVEINPATQPTEFTQALKINGKVKTGGLLAGSRNASFQIEKSQPSASLTSDNSLFIPFVYALPADRKLKGFYLQVKGASVYWDIPYKVLSARVDAANANPERNGYVLDIGIPAHIRTGKFEVLYQLYDDQGNVTEPMTMSGEIVPSVDFCATGGMTLGKVNGRDGITVRSYELGNQPGWVTIRYNTFTVKDRIDIQYAGEWVRSTGALLKKGTTPPIGKCNSVSAEQGFVGQQSEFNIYYDPKKGKRIDIYVSGCMDGGTQWEFEITDCPSERAILGLHSSEPADNCKYDCNRLGHAWVSLTDNGKTTYYGLWPDDHDEVTRRGLGNGNGSDIRTGIEGGFGEVTRYYLIDNAQKQNFENFLQRNLTYKLLSYNCTSFASDIVFATVGERVNNKNLASGFFPTPCAMSRSIEQLNATNPRLNYTPIGLKFTTFSRAFCE